MVHESNKGIIRVEDTVMSFESIYNETYFPKELLNEISKANMLIIPEALQTSKEIAVKEVLNYQYQRFQHKL